MDVVNKEAYLRRIRIDLRPDNLVPDDSFVLVFLEHFFLQERKVSNRP